MKYTIILVEDEINLNNLIKTYLEKSGYNVIPYYNGTDAINNTNINAKNGITIQELLASEIKEKNAVAAKYNNEIKSLNYKLENDGTIELLDISSKDGIRAYRKGLLFIVDKAITELYPNAKMIVNFQLSNSLLCEFDNLEITDEVIEKVNKRVKEIVELDLPIVKQYMTKEEAAKFYEENDTTKGRLQLELKNKKEVSLYWCEDYFNYFYGIMPTHTGIMNIYEIIKYHRGILIRYPNKKDITKLAEFKEHKKLLSTLDEDDYAIVKSLAFEILDSEEKMAQLNLFTP